MPVLNPDTLVAFAGALVAAILAVAAVLRPPRNLARWMFTAGMLTLACESGFVGMATLAQHPAQLIHWLNGRLGAMALLPGFWLCFSLTYARGNAREFLRKWWLPVLLAFAIPVGLTLWVRGQFIDPQAWANPNHPHAFGLGMAARALFLVRLVGTILVLTNLERTFRASVGTQRWRIKYVILGLGLLFVVRAYTASQEFLFNPLDPLLQVINSTALVLACLLIAVSIPRVGRFEVDVYPSRAVLHGSLTLLLAGAYLLMVGVLAKVAAFLGGDAAFAPKAFVVLVALVALVILLLSERVRLFTRQLVSRHFDRPLHDYRRVWETFTERTTSCTNQDELCRAVVQLVSEYFQALSVSIWLVVPERKQLLLGASTSFPEARANDLKPSSVDAGEVIRGVGQLQAPVDIEASHEPWAAALRRCAPHEFRTGGSRICMPLSAGGQLLGLMVLGDRVGGSSFTVQDLDLVKNLGGQAAASLLNLQLAERLVQAREMEAFQSMSAFFVHDLKNTASTLSLLLQNLPVHFDNPEFREDTLRGVSSTVAHINGLIQRLSSLRQHLETRPVESDLNAVVTGALENLPLPPEVQLRTTLAPLPKMSLDPAQLREVVTNLVINAREALEGRGEIRVETRRENSSVVLSVLDNGPGMTREFVDRSLFRPFQSTKKNGIGIGMFQCKTIVEAHRGRIDVESEPGQGTAFHVRLPLPRHDHET
jgi:putative PEP-CTERM system histidine kinase